MRERPNRAVSKTVVRTAYRGFESHSLRSRAEASRGLRSAPDGPGRHRPLPFGARPWRASSRAGHRPLARTVRRRHRLAATIAALATFAAVPVARAGILNRTLRPAVAPERAGTATAVAAATPTVLVRGRRLVDGAGAPVTLIGVNRSGTEYACAQGWGIFDGPSSTASLEAMRAWGVNTVRVPLNEDCWLGMNVPPSYSGAVYRQAIVDYVDRIGALGMYAILDLHWGTPGDEPALGQEAMPDPHAVAFWRSVAITFRGDRGTLFELLNEPHDVTWACWLHGCTLPGGWQAVGMQALVGVVRAAGGRQPIIVDGLDWANNLTGLIAHLPSDPLHEVVAGFHAYPWNSCATVACWKDEVAPVAARIPVVATEVGQKNCNVMFVKDFLLWASASDVSPVAWTWDTNEGCRALIQAYTGAPTHYGTYVRSGFRDFAANIAGARGAGVGTAGRRG